MSRGLGKIVIIALNSFSRPGSKCSFYILPSGLGIWKRCCVRCDCFFLRTRTPPHSPTPHPPTPHTKRSSGGQQKEQKELESKIRYIKRDTRSINFRRLCRSEQESLSKRFSWSQHFVYLKLTSGWKADYWMFNFFAFYAFLKLL